MSVDKWAYDPKYCDGEICVGDCDLCDKPQIMDDDEELRGWRFWYEVVSSDTVPESVTYIPHAACKYCGEEIETYRARKLTKCPNCGAVMRGDNNGKSNE